jgi:hypothetical protein
MNAHERLKSVLEAFGIDGSNGGQQQLDFGNDAKGEDNQSEDNDSQSADEEAQDDD